MHKVKALGEDHKISGRVRIKPEKIEKILKWPLPQDRSGVKGFLGIVGTTRRWIKAYSELLRPL